jgi:hypothetical protein
MKKPGRIQFFAGLCLAIVSAGLVLAGCFNILEPDGKGGPEGAVRIYLAGDGSGARAMLPSAPVFSKYSLSFSGKDGQAPAADITNITPAEITGTGKTVSLGAGRWTITATGYVTLSGIPGLANGDYPAARGSVDITVSPGEDISAAVSIDPITGEGEGVMNYNVPFPAYADSAVLKVLNLDGTALAAPVQVDLKTGSSGTLVIPSGYYFLEVTVSRTGVDAETAAVMDGLHIYSGMTTNVYLTDDFTVIQKTVISGAALNLDGLVAPPFGGRPPDTGPIDTPWYTGTAAWKESGGASATGDFSWGTAYTAVLSLSAKEGFTFAGIGADAFSCAGAAAVTNAAGSGTVSITYPVLPASLPDAAVLRFAVDGAGNAFTALPSSGASWNAVLNGGASIKTEEGFKVVDVGGSNGYVDLNSKTGTLIKSLPEFSIETYVCVPSETSLSGNGHFVWTLGSTNTVTASAGSYMFFRAAEQTFAISQAGWNSAQSTPGKGNIGKGQWKHIVVTRESDYTTTVYVNGAELSKSAGDSMTIDHTGGDFAALAYCYLARPVFSGDNYLKNAMYYRFNIYDKALTAAETANGLGAAEILTVFNKSPAPLITNDTFAKTGNAEKFVSFVLGAYYAGTGKLYTASTGGGLVSGVSASFNRNVLTLTADSADVPEGEYYVTLTEEFARESDRVRLTLTPYVPPSRVITLSFGGVPSDPVTVSGGGVSVPQTGGPLTITLNNAAGFTDYQWWLDGEKQNSETGSSYSIVLTGLSAGTHRVMIAAYKDGVPYSGETSFTVTN